MQSSQHSARWIVTHPRVLSANCGRWWLQSNRCLEFM